MITDWSHFGHSCHELSCSSGTSTTVVQEHPIWSLRGFVSSSLFVAPRRWIIFHSHLLPARHWRPQALSSPKPFKLHSTTTALSQISTKSHEVLQILGTVLHGPPPIYLLLTSTGFKHTTGKSWFMSHQWDAYATSLHSGATSWNIILWNYQDLAQAYKP